METKRLTKLALLTTVALIIFVVESYIPVPVPIPGIKLGLANIITVYAAFTMTAADAVLILVCRIVLGSLFTGTAVSMIYSLGGGALCIAVTSAERCLSPVKKPSGPAFFFRLRIRACARQIPFILLLK